MRAGGDRARIELRGLRKRGRVKAAILVLNGARTADLRRASSLGGSLAETCLLVAVDGGLATCLAARRRPDLFVGDGDSGHPPDDVPVVLYARDKDFSDLAGALGELQQRRIQVVMVAGLLGGRLDHEWSNLLELGRQAGGFAGILAPTERGTVVITANGCRTATVRGRTVSIFALGASATVSLQGTRWELERRRLRPGSSGLSNLTGTDLDLTVHAGVVAVVFVPPPRRVPSS